FSGLCSNAHIVALQRIDQRGILRRDRLELAAIHVGAAYFLALNDDFAHIAGIYIRQETRIGDFRPCAFLRSRPLKQIEQRDQKQRAENPDSEVLEIGQGLSLFTRLQPRHPMWPRLHSRSRATAPSRVLSVSNLEEHSDHRK